MTECPFCGSDVSDDLVTYGGTCPKCFAEIPGEEAPTDPGAEVRAAQERRDRARAAIPAMVGLAALAFLVTCTGVVAATFALWPDPEVAELIDFDTMEFPMPEIVGAEVPPASSGGSAAPSVAPRSSSGSVEDRIAKLEGSSGGVGSGAASASELGDDAVASASSGPRGPREISGPAAPDLSIGPGPTHKAGSIDLSIGARQVRRDENLVLDDPVAIRNMIGEEMAKRIPALIQCYNRRLKVDQGLRGRWRISFTVGTEGNVTTAGASGLDRKDAELEGCIAKEIRDNWDFGKISKATPVAKTLTFKPR